MITLLEVILLLRFLNKNMLTGFLSHRKRSVIARDNAARQGRRVFLENRVLYEYYLPQGSCNIVR